MFMTIRDLEGNENWFRKTSSSIEVILSDFGSFFCEEEEEKSEKILTLIVGGVQKVMDRSEIVR